MRGNFSKLQNVIIKNHIVASFDSRDSRLDLQFFTRLIDVDITDPDSTRRLQIG